MSGIVVHGLSGEYGPVRLDIDHLEVGSGRTLVLFGPNGAGKTSLLRRLAGVIPGGPIVDAAYLPQRPWMFRGSAGRNLGLGLDDAGRARALELAADLGVEDALDRRGPTLSGGERQRLALARTLARPEANVLLDEPLTAIDATERSLVGGRLRGWLADRTAIVVTHDRDEAAVLGDDLAVMVGGRILQQGPVDTVLRLPVDADVAAVLGVGNFLRGEVVGSESGLLTVECGPVTVTGLGSMPVGEAVTALFGGEVVTLHAGRHGSSGYARNSWTGRVESIRRIGRLVEVEVDVGVPIVATVTPGSLDALGLRGGAHVTLTVKATAIHVVPG